MFALLVYYFHQQRNWAQAHKLIEEMRGRNILLDPFLEPAIIEEVYRCVCLFVWGGGGGAMHCLLHPLTQPHTHPTAKLQGSWH